MRLSESRIKSGILHSDPSVRDAAVDYFSGSFSEDPTIMPVAIEAIERFGWNDTFSDEVTLEGLDQTDETTSWLIHQLCREGDGADPEWTEYLGDVSWILASSNAQRLKRRRKEIDSLPQLDPDAREAIAERTRLLTVPFGKCWEELDDFCRRMAAHDSFDRREIAHLTHAVEAVSRHAEECTRHVRSILTDGAISGEGTTSKDPAGRLEGTAAYWDVLAVRMAGQMRWQPAIPYLVERLSGESEWVLDECVTALVRMGTDTASKAVWNGCANGSEGFRESAAWVLGAIHTDLAAEACLHLFHAERDSSLKIAMAFAVLAQFDVDGVGPVRQLILDEPSSNELVELRHVLLAVCLLMEARFPELVQWREELQQHLQLRAQCQTPDFPVTDTWSEALAQVDDRKPDPPPIRFPKPKKPQQHVGRNEQCPCQSGKKFKRCCGRRT